MTTVSTYLTLREGVASWSARDDLTDLIPDFINYAHMEIGRTLRANVNTLTADLAISGESVAIPTRFRMGKRIYLDTTPRRIVQFTSPEIRASVTAEYTSAQYPEWAAVEGDYIFFGPVPTTTATGKILYYATPATLSADGDTNVVLTKYPFMYLYGALAELFRYIEDVDNADRYETRFRGLIAEVNKTEAWDNIGSMTQGRPSAGSVV